MKVLRFFSLSVFLLFTSCVSDSSDGLSYSIPAPTTAGQDLIIHPDSIFVEGDLGLFSVEKTVETEIEGVQLITFSFTAGQASELQPIAIQFKFPSLDISGYWNPGISVDKVNYYYSGITSKASRYAPVLSFYNGGLQNRICIALSDALNQSVIKSELKEEDVHFHPTIKLFQEKMPATTAYSIALRIDTRGIPYYEAIDDVASWWAGNPEYKPMAVPDGAKNPMYSTWYSYHQGISAEEIVAECKVAKSLGCGAVIVDDGWQTKDGNRGYAFTGDWNPDRIPDMKGFVEDVHAEGMQFILWYSLPFMGEKAKNYDQFKGKYLRYWESQGTYVLDPRYPEVREYIVNTYIKALEDWNLDGFKLDFIGRFYSDQDTKLSRENGRDIASVNEATDVLMTEITTRLTAIKPDILIEFRQPYTGPLMRKYGNMFRGVDAPNNAVANRIETVNLRILSQGTAVHSDMFIWRKEETVEQAALQILNILYSVPQLSVKLAEIPETHLDMIRYWFGYWNENRNVLLEGDFFPGNPGACYPSLTAREGEKQISTAYEDIVLEVLPGIEKLDIVNAKATQPVAFRLGEPRNGALTIKDCKGTVIIELEVSFAKGIHEIEIPISGMASLDLS